MARPDFTEEDYSDLAALVREAIDAEPYRIGPRMSKLKRLLAKLEPATEGAEPPMPSAQPSLLYAKLRSARSKVMAARGVYKATDGSWRQADADKSVRLLYRLRKRERWTLLDGDRAMVVHPDRPAKIIYPDGRVEEIASEGNR